MKKKIENILFILSIISCFFSCSDFNKNQEKKIENNDILEQKDEKDFLNGTWKLISIADKPVPEDRKNVTVEFNKKGRFIRSISADYKAEEGEWFIENYEGKKYLSLQIGDIKEMNELVLLNENELVFLNKNKAVRLLKISNTQI